MNFTCISPEQAENLIAEKTVTLVDFRDKASFLAAHIDNAVHLDNNNAQEFIDSQNKNTPVIIYCYHGISSQGAAEYLAKQGFRELYSVDGGFEHWKTLR